MIRLDIFSDPVCPWCLIGKLELDRALESRPDHPFDIIWQPFRLNPQMPRGGMDRLDYLKAKPGAADAARAVAERAAKMGLDLKLPTRQPSTSDAHRLMHWAALEGVQTRVMSGLLRAYWQEGRDIGDHVELAEIASAAGMDKAVTTRLLQGDADRDEVNSREGHARERGVNAVPTFIIANQHVVSGAQPADLWQQVIDDIATQKS